MAFGRGIASKRDIAQLQSELESCARNLNRAMAVATLANVERLRELLEKANPSLSNISQDLMKIKVAIENGSQLLDEIVSLQITSKKALVTINQRAILNSLKPNSANARLDEIRGRASDTFNWIFEPSDKLLRRVPKVEEQISTWFRSGSGIFHVVGKPGSGKSTLMKFLTTHGNTRALLESWAEQRNGKQVIISSFFFWKLGIGEQKTMRGLLRGLISEVLQEVPDMARLLFPKHWDPQRYLMNDTTPILPKISDEDVHQAFELLKQQPEIREKFSFCFFIDGIDEFSEPDMSVSALVSRLRTLNWDPKSREELSLHRASLPDHIKMCVSSRDLPEITLGLPGPQRMLLHLFTRSDIEIVVRTTLEENEQFQAIAKAESEKCQLLVKKIIDDANGVFLWVTLLLKLLEDKLSTSVTSIHILEKTVSEVPTELEDFFRKILDSITKPCRGGAYVIFAMVVRMTEMLISNHESFHDNCVHSEYHEPQHTCLSLIGLRTVMQGLEQSLEWARFGKDQDQNSTCSSPEEYQHHQEQAQAMLSVWGKCLLEVDNKAEDFQREGNIKGHGFV
ncbi:unnamed protein product [Clonostachys chloroleuca]|uniref:Nephrocystin 3-like N-terminal domain-containing protein n=1 Tax=Clonostachys chloroleuca TaxID=1926264 RepID=A0AA35LRI6_9HYPO|nr:unnamed protein product [Clonostachys chloroleuca]